MFLYDPGGYRQEFCSKGYVHLKNILTEGFRQSLVAFYTNSMDSNENEIGRWSIYGKKRQFLFDFSSTAQADDFRHGMARLTGIDPERFTISERHLKVYDKTAPPWPAPHKDRAASEISVGLPIHIPSGSTACVFPELEFGHNHEERAVFLSADGDAERLYRTEEAVMLNEEVGDVIAFLGSSIFHERVHAANAAIVYLKVNGTGRDPLRENIFARDFSEGEKSESIQSLTLA